MLKPLLKGDPAKPKEEELDGSIERQLASLGQMKDLVSCLDQRRRDYGMVRNLSKRRRRVTTQVVESHDMEVVAQKVALIRLPYFSQSYLYFFQIFFLNDLLTLAGSQRCY